MLRYRVLRADVDSALLGLDSWDKVLVDTQVGDEIGIFLGAKVPVVLRKVEDNRYLLVGEDYVHGIMNGEAFHVDDFNVRDIDLV